MARTSLDDRDRALIQGRNFCHVAAPDPDDGHIHTVIVWCDLDGDRIVVNTAEGRRWLEGVRNAGRATLTVPDAANPYEYVRVMARLDETTNEGAIDVANALTKKYMDQDEYPFLQPGEVRVTLKFAPERVSRWGG